MLTRLEIVNFRNLRSTSVELSKGLNIFWGNNAQGKTNFLEAVYLLSTGKSFRAETDQELIRWKETAAKIIGEAPPLQIELTIEESGKKLLVNRQNKRLIELIGEFLVVLFSPEDLLLLTGPPTLRRAWLNSLISRVDKNYLFNLAKLTRVLKNRNRLLLLASRGSRTDLKVWDDQLIELSSHIWVSRKDFIGKIERILKSLSAKLGVERIFLEYHPQLEIKSLKETKESLAKKLTSLREEELKRAQTLVGPHRDDFKVIFETTQEEAVLSKDVGVYGSRGEQRTAILSLKLAELELVQAEKGRRPTLLLDDILSEFDRAHREMIQSLLYHQQSLLTTTSLGFIDPKIVEKAKVFYVEKGDVKANAQGDGKEPSA